MSGCKRQRADRPARRSGWERLGGGGEAKWDMPGHAKESGPWTGKSGKKKQQKGQGRGEGEMLNICCEQWVYTAWI